MKAISVKQPWASLIARGSKTVEVRTWATKYRGPLLIVAGLQPDNNIMKKTAKSNATGAVWLNDLYPENKLSGWYPLGAAVCVVNIVGCEPFSNEKHAEGAAFESDFAEKLFAWLLSNPQPVQPFKIKGKLNFYEVDEYLIKIK